MLAYVDESGNTGRNLFDKDQPFFYCAALMRRLRFEIFI